MGLLFLGLILFLLLVIFHELGHFFAARRGGVEVEEFGIGFPPKVYGRKFKGHKTEYTLNLLPLGGFVRLKGEHDGDTEKGSFGAARLKTKIKIMLAGVGVNFLIAWFMLLVLALIGVPQLPLPGGEKQFTVAADTNIVRSSVLVAHVEPESPAHASGLSKRDTLTHIYPADHCFDCVTEKSEFSINNGDNLRQATSRFAGQEVVLGYERGGEVYRSQTVRLLSDDEVRASSQTDSPKGYLGVVPYDYSVARSTWSAPIVATGLTYQYTKLTLEGLGGALKNLVIGNAAQAGENVSGPVGIFFVLKDGSMLGFRYVLLIVALLSLTLAIMNTLPIPALDGGRLFVTLLFRLLKKPLTPELEERIHGTGFAALLLLFVVITIVDVRRFF